MLQTLALVALSAAAYTAVFPPWEWVGLSWVALAPLLGSIDRNEGGPARGAWVGALWALLASAGVIAWVLPTLHDYFELSWPLSTGLFALVCTATAAPYYAAAFALLCGVRPHLPRTAWLLLIPAVWVLAEWARTRLGLRSAWATLGAAHYDAERLRQVADVCAVYGVSALVALGNAVAYEAARVVFARQRGTRLDAAPLGRVGSVFAILLATALAYGQWRRGPEVAPADAPEVLLVQAAREPELRWRRVHATQVLRSYGRLTREALATGARPVLVVWPENAIQTAPDDPMLGPPLHAFVASAGLPLLLGAPRSEADVAGARRQFNAAHLLHPSGAAEHYDKMRLLPFSETAVLPGRTARGDLDATSYSAGRELGLFDVAGERLGVLICFEAIYPELARDLAQRGATALVNLSNDGWHRGRGGARQHLQLSVFRAIETGLPLLRVTTTGITAAIAPDGRIVASLAEGQAAALRTALPARRATATLYVRAGDSFAALCTAACAGALIASVGRRRRRSPSGTHGSGLFFASRACR